MSETAEKTETPAGFFGQHGQVSGGGDYETVEAGAYTCKLVSVTKEDRPSFEDPNKLVPSFVWKFEATEIVQSTGEPFQFLNYTGVKFGNDKANLTKLLDGMFARRISAEEFQALNVGDLQRQPWRLLISEELNKEGKMKNRIEQVNPLKRAVPRQAGQAVDLRANPPTQTAQAATLPAPAPVPADDLDDLEDPFAENAPPFKGQ